MIVDLMDFCEQCALQGMKLSQKQLCEIISTNRYTVSMVMNEKDGIYNIPPDKGVKLWLFNPNAIELPKDFFYYTTVTFYAAKAIEGLNMAEISRRVEMPLTTITNIAKGNNFFLYDHKDIFGAFENIYIPRYREKDIIEVFDGKDYKDRVKAFIEKGKLPGKVDKKNLMGTMAAHGMDPSRINTIRKEFKGAINAQFGKTKTDMQDAILMQGFAKKCKVEVVKRPDESKS